MVNLEKLPVLVTGDSKLACSVTVCLLKAGFNVKLYTNDVEKARIQTDIYVNDILKYHTSIIINRELLKITNSLDKSEPYLVAIALTTEDIESKIKIVDDLESCLPDHALIVINSESIGLDLIQEKAVQPQRVLVANWSYPAHTTFFLEIITNEINEKTLSGQFDQLAKDFLEKDPYIIKGNCGINARLVSSMAREAFYLVENGFATIQDIDRACRNDAGYYLPFAGNFRYMDLMGTYSYGAVMKDLNPELSKEKEVPQFFKEIIRKGYLGMTSSRGMYEYTDKEVEDWSVLFNKFSHQIREIMQKYPFNYRRESHE